MICFFFFFKQKTAYEMRISDWSSDVCSSDLIALTVVSATGHLLRQEGRHLREGDQQADHDHHDDEERQRRPRQVEQEIGRASCRERVCQYVYISVVAVSLKKKKNEQSHITHTDNKQRHSHEHNIIIPR